MVPFTEDNLQAIEAYLAADECARVAPDLEALVAHMETYIDEHCVTTDAVQYFSFSSTFENVTYHRVEDDPRKTVVVEAPFDRAYADLAFCYIKLGDYEQAAEALKQAVRWNPMNCAHRLDLAGVMTRLGEPDEAIKLSYSVFARASRSSHLARAYLNFYDYFRAADQYETACACVKFALRFAPEDRRVLAAADRLASEHQRDPRTQSDEVAHRLLDEQGIPDGANVEVVLSALLLADIAMESGDSETYRDMVQIAVDLVGQKSADALFQIVRDEKGE